MNPKILYHGLKYIIENPIYRGGKETNDYGYSFYCTENIEIAKEWACPDNNDGYANKYELDKFKKTLKCKINWFCTFKLHFKIKLHIILL